MGQAVAIKRAQEELILAAYKDPLKQLSAIIPYLHQRHEAAKELVDKYSGNDEAGQHLLSLIKTLNKDIARILGIQTEQNTQP